MISMIVKVALVAGSAGALTAPVARRPRARLSATSSPGAAIFERVKGGVGLGDAASKLLDRDL